MNKREREVRLFILSTESNQRATQKAEEWLRKHDVDYTCFDLVEKKPTRDEVLRWMKHSDFKPKKFVNVEDTSDRHKAEEKSDKEFASWLINHPEEVELPILEINHEVKMFGFEATKYEEYLGE